MLNHISIELDVHSLIYSNQIVGNIAVVIDFHDYFPGQGWSDFVAIVLNWWADNARALVFAPLRETYSFQFMDGPIRIAAKKMTATDVELTFVEEGHPKTLMGTVSLEGLKDALIKASHQLLNAVDRNGWKNEEIEQLRYAVKMLRTY
ncbi:MULTISPECIES: hypothetical protein [Exiguobacterium]|uniref:hypothetical protein n=1 Tax=Exiguobacterium TaxID=33986 RepID=UPI001BE862CF|nr:MULTISPECIES: hypothetical protein [Exiguobacterium]MCT4777160.1 hypothetical protein [Exiguobacterium aquaticum]MCT4789346.1 hypothetical protein [Exiguobacterium mexicanum]